MNKNNKEPLDQVIQNCEEMKKLRLFHGSEKIVEFPQFGLGKPKNDFGRGFYCTEIEQLAKEWAAPSADQLGYCNEYRFDMSGLKVLDLHNPQFHILNWASLLFKYRNFATHSYAAKANIEYFTKNFCIDISNYDVVIGSRADDSYFYWAKDFIEDQISLEQLERAMRYGNLGDQIVLISPKAFDQIEFIHATKVDKDFYYQRVKRNEKANNRYAREKMEIPRGQYDFMASHIREGGFVNEDFCVSRDIPGNRGR